MADPIVCSEWLNSFDWILLNSSAGKDSQTMLRYVYNLSKDHVDRAKMVVVHADLGRMEWAGTPELARKQAEHYGLRFEITRREQNDLLEHVRQRGRWPSNKQRYCTSDHKRGPIRLVMTRLAKEYRSNGGKRKPCRILNCMGMRAQESPARAKKDPYSFDKSASNGRREVMNWLPIHGWSIDEVWADIKASDVPHHAAYDLGMPRLSCCFCIFAPKAALKLAGRHNPELLAEYAEVERQTGHSFRVDVSLQDIQKELTESNVGHESVSDWNM